MRFSLRSPDWWWIMPLTLLVHVVIADPFDNHHRRQTSPNNVLDLIVSKGNVYDLNGTPQMPRGGPGGPLGGEEAVIVNRDLAGGSNFGSEGSHNDKRFEPLALLEKKESSDHENNARLFLNADSVDHGKHTGHSVGVTTEKRNDVEERAFNVPSPKLHVRGEGPDNGEPKSGKRSGLVNDKGDDTPALRAEPISADERALETMEVAARDGKFEETMRIEYLKKRGLGQAKAPIEPRSPRGPIHGGNYCAECGCC